MMKNLLIIGARGFGREVYNLALDCIKAGENIRIKGFLDDKSDALDAYPNYPPIISSVENYNIEKEDVFICALGDVKYKEKYVTIIQQKGGEFISLVHPAAMIGTNTIIGRGCIIRTLCSISCDVAIGNFVTMMGFVNIGHDAQIADWCHIGAYSFLGGGTALENSATLHPGCKILPHKKIGCCAIVGAGSVVLRNVKANTTVFGIPAKRINISNDINTTN